MAISHVLMIARTEALQVTRSWIFRFFALFAVIGLSVSNVVLFVSVDAWPQIAEWMIRAIPSAVPYFNVLLLTVIESQVLVFAAVDSLRRDFMFDTSDSLHARNVTNAHYIIGKALGTILPFLIFNVLYLLLVFIGNGIFMSDVPVVWQVYLLYPLIINIPALIFITGFSFFVMTMLKYAPLVYLFVLLIIVAPLFLTSGIVSGILDYSALHLPLLYSDFIGFGNVGDIVMHRSYFLLLGLGMTSIAILLFSRLPQSRKGQQGVRMAACACTAAGILLGLAIILGEYNEIHSRERIQVLNEVYMTHSRARLTSCHLDIEHRGARLEVHARLTFTNPHTVPLDRISCTLNPGFAVSEVTSRGEPLVFNRELHMLHIMIPPLSAGAQMTVTVVYDGTILDETCHPDIARDERKAINRLFTYVIDKRYGVITPEYVLLTPASNWYPVSGVSYETVFPNMAERDFIEFTVDGMTQDNLTVISQGVVEQSASGGFTIRPENKLPGLSLIIGDYEKKSLIVDDLELAVFSRPGHDYFSAAFRSKSAIMMKTLSEIKADYEHNKGLMYPYPRYYLVEVPVQFHAYERPWTTYMETVQPQLSLMPEKGFFIQHLDIMGIHASYVRMYERNGLNADDETIVSGIIRTIIYNVLMSDRTQREHSRSLRMHKPPVLHLSRLLNPSRYGYVPGYTFSSQFYPFLLSLESDQYPVFNVVMDFYRKHGLNTNTQFDNLRYTTALLDEEIACMALEHATFEQYLEEDSDFDTLNTLLTLKANHLFGSIQATLGGTRFDGFLNHFIAHHTYEQVGFDEFSEAVHDTFGLDMNNILKTWYADDRLPLFSISDALVTEVMEGEHVSYQTMFTITNTGEVPGTVWIGVRLQGSGISVDRETRFIRLAGRQTKQIGILTSTPPVDMAVNTLISKNLPIMFRRMLGKPEPDHDREPLDGERIIAFEDQSPPPGTIVIDNLDSGFEIVSNPPDAGDHAFYGFGLYPEDYVICVLSMPPSQWGKGVLDEAYGSKQTVHYIKGGHGNGKACWQTEIPASGRYDLEYYIPDFAAKGWTMTIRDEDSALPLIGDHELVIEYGEDVYTITVVPAQGTDWHYVSSFELPPGPVRVYLTDKSNGMCVYADAIRWVKQKTISTSQLITF